MQLRCSIRAFVLLLPIATAAFSQAPRGLARAEVGGRHIVIDYGRPFLRARDLLEHTLPGAVWRLGGDEPTVLRSDIPLSFPGGTIPAGAYRLVVHRVDDENWRLIFNVHAGQLGPNREPGLNVAAVQLELADGDLEERQLLIAFAPVDEGGTELRIHWGFHVLRAAFAVDGVSP